MYSVVIPVYQSKESLARCVESWLLQTQTEIELILVDDGSTDGSGALCDSYAEADGRVRVLHQENAGVSAARNAGIQKAQGEFLLFTDSDDYVAPDYLQKMAALQREGDCDLVLCGFHHLYDGADIRKSPGETKIWRIESFPEDFLDLYAKSFLNMPWNKLYRREWAGNFDSSLSLGEDLLFNLDYLRKCRRVAVLEEPLCYYVQEERKETLSSKKRKNRLELSRRICEETERFYKEQWRKEPDGRIFTRYMDEILDECEKLPVDKEATYQEKLAEIRAYARDGFVKRRGKEAALSLPDYRILWFFLKRDMPRTVYLLCVLRRLAVVLVHWMRRRAQGCSL